VSGTNASGSENPCHDCGVCCLAHSLPPFDANEVARAPDALIREIEAYTRSARHRDSHPCLWLDLATGKCMHHDVRPVLCRWFAPGGKACNDLRAEAGLPPLAAEPSGAP
jgi:Fe-S-cluster containining protein